MFFWEKSEKYFFVECSFELMRVHIAAAVVVLSFALSDFSGKILVDTSFPGKVFPVLKVEARRQ